MLPTRDWDYISELCERRGEIDYMVLSREVGKIPDKRLLHSFGPLLYQEYLYALCRIVRPHVVIETGTRYGVGSTMILRALDKNEQGRLYSCDPMHPSRQAAMEKMRELHGFSSFDRFEFYPDVSSRVLDKIAKFEPWDIFVHDSDHSKTNMEWELEFALEHLGPRGIIVCDDWDWPDEHDERRQPHRALERFCARHGFAWNRIGTAAVLEVGSVSRF